MPKIILETTDIEKLIKEKYPDAEIISGCDNIEITIRIVDFQKVPQQQTQKVEPKKEVRLSDGNIDAVASGLSLENREHTVPGKAMGRVRGNMPTF